MSRSRKFTDKYENQDNPRHDRRRRPVGAGLRPTNPEARRRMGRALVDLALAEAETAAQLAAEREVQSGGNSEARS